MPLILGTNSIKDTGFNVANSCRFSGGNDYLRTNGYDDPKGKQQPFLSDTGFNRFMAHIRKEKSMDIK